MPLYNLTEVVGNSTGVLGFMQGVNQHLMAGWMGTLWLIGISLVLLFAFMFKTGDVNKSLSATAFISFSLALSLRAIGLINNDLVLIITLILAAGTLAFAWPRQ